MSAGALSSRRPLSIIIAGAAMLSAWAIPAGADSMRVDTDWHVDVYIGESGQFYHILNPKDGSVVQVSKKRKDISAPRLSKDPAERAKLKSDWEAAAKAREKADSRETELRVQTRALSQPDMETLQPRPARRVLSPEEEAAEAAEWQRVLDERRAVMEERQRILNERAGIYEPVPEEEMPVESEAPLAEEAAGDPNAAPAPPGPRAQPERTAQPEAPTPSQEEIEQMAAEPYFQNEQERYYYEQQRAQEMERMQAEAYAWQEIEAQGYVDASGYMGDPSQQAPGGEALPPAPEDGTGDNGEN